ncbi:MAG: hypothetical protein R6W94_15300, partial [Spirochaetia bacterium]
MRCSPPGRRRVPRPTRSRIVDFYVADLDGSNVERIHETGDISSSFEFKLIERDDTVYLYSLENKTLKNVIINNGSVSGTYTLQTDVTSLLVPEESNSYIYYSRDLKESDDFILDKGNILSKMEIGTSSEEVLVRDNSSEFTLDIYREGVIYYRKTSDNMDSTKHFYRNIKETNFQNANEIQLTASSYSENIDLEFDLFDSYRGFVVADGSKIVLI